MRRPCHAGLWPASAGSCRQQRSMHGLVLILLEKSHMLLDDGDVAPSFQPRPILVGSRTGPVHRQDVPRQDVNLFSRVNHTRERPVNPVSSHLLPVRGVKREPTSVIEHTHDRPHGATRSFRRGAVEAQPPSSAHSGDDKFVSAVPKHQPLRETLDPGLHGWVRIMEQAMTMLDVTHLPDLGPRPDTLQGGRRNLHSRNSKASAWPDVGTVESGSFLGVTTDDSEPFATFRSLAQAFSHHTNSTSCASSRVSTPRSRVRLVTPKWIPSSSRPLRRRGSVSTSERQMVDLGEMTKLSLSQAKEMISAASTISLITAV